MSKHPLPNEEELRRLKNLMTYEKKARKQGFKVIAGIDEAGRGPLAGPVVAAACILPYNLLIPGVDDSKKLTPKQRHDLFEHITTHKKIRFGIGIIEAAVIDTVNIFQATILAMLQAIEQLVPQPDFLLVDGLQLKQSPIPAERIVQGDGLSQSIAAASIIAKETRDRIMRKHHEQWPEYGFDRHKGYGTKLHLEAIEKYGCCELHRKSFAPIKQDGTAIIEELALC